MWLFLQKPWDQEKDWDDEMDMNSINKWRKMTSLNIIFQYLLDILSGRLAMWPDMSNRSFNVIFIFFAPCVGMSTRNACLDIQHMVNPQRFNESLTLYTTQIGFNNIAERGILTTF